MKLRPAVAALVAVALAACADDPSSPRLEPFQPSMDAVGDGPDGPRWIVSIDEESPAVDVARGHGIAAGRFYSRALRGFVAELSEPQLERLRMDPRVLRIEPDIEVHTTQTQWGASDWGLDRLDQRTIPLDGLYQVDRTGLGVTAYVVDTGIQLSHSEFGARARFGFDALGGDGTDCHGHGTHVAGTVGGSRYGVAPAVDLVAVRVLDCAGSGTASGVIAGLEWILENGAAPAVVNMSLGGSASDAIDDAVRNVIATGIPVVVAAGNDGDDACWTSPARTAEAITVGATDPSDRRAYFSNFGECVDWFAPGVQITSAYIGPDIATMSGTSMAAPHAAGTVALLLDWDPTLSPEAVADSLYSFATKNVVGDAMWDNAHILHTGRAHQPDDGDPPAWDVIEMPSNLGVTMGTAEPSATIRWQNVDARTDWIEVAIRWEGLTTWHIIKRVRPYVDSFQQLLEPSTEYEFSVRSADVVGSVWRYSAWVPSITERTCDSQGGSSKCSTSTDSGGSTDDDGSGKGGSKSGNGKGRK